MFVPQFGENDKEMHPAIRVPVIRHSGSDEGGTDGVLAGTDCAQEPLKTASKMQRRIFLVT